MVLGIPQKTAFIRRFITGFFNEDIQMTIGADFSLKTVKIGDRIVKLRIWDLSDEERFRNLLSNYINDSKGVIIMYDVIDEKTVKIISEYIELIKSKAGDIPIFLNIPDLSSKSKEIAFLTEKYSFDEITSETGSTGEHAFELLTKRIFEYVHLN